MSNIFIYFMYNILFMYYNNIFKGTIRPYVSNVDYTGATVHIKQRRNIENPFNSVHLAALINFGELV